MFLHNLKYAFKTMLKNRIGLIWTVIFPMALGTFMFFAFGNIFESDELFHKIPVALVENVPDENLNTVLEGLSKPDNDILEVSKMDEAAALKALDDGDITAVIYEDDELSMTVTEESYSVSVVKTILDEYKRNTALITEILTENPTADMEKLMPIVMGDIKYHETRNSSNKNQDALTNYFFAIFAMSCLFASFTSTEKTSQIQASSGALGLRRSLTPSSKTSLVLAEFTVMLVFQFLAEILTLVYFSILGIKFYDIPAILLILLLGSAIGISIGIVISSFLKVSEGAKQGICVAFCMALSVMADLCVNGIMNMVEHSVPILNRINPAVLISDSFYALSVYDDYSRYFRNIISLAGIAFILITISILSLRRNKYASV